MGYQPIHNCRFAYQRHSRQEVKCTHPSARTSLIGYRSCIFIDSRVSGCKFEEPELRPAPPPMPPVKPPMKQ